MRWIAVLSVIVALLTPALARDEGHGHHHEPHHWESAEMRRELLTQMGGIGAAGVLAGGYWLTRRRSRV